MIDKIKARIEEIEKAIQNCVAQHAQLVGHLEESKYFLKMAEEGNESPAETAIAEDAKAE